MNETKWIVEKFDDAISDIMGADYVESHRKMGNYECDRWEHLRRAIIKSFVHDVGSEISKKVLRAACKYEEEKGLVDFSDPEIVEAEKSN